MYDRTFGDFPAKNAVYTPYIYIWFWPTLCIYGIFGRGITIHTVMYGVYVGFWPILGMCCMCALFEQVHALNVLLMIAIISGNYATG